MPSYKLHHKTSNGQKWLHTAQPHLGQQGLQVSSAGSCKWAARDSPGLQVSSKELQETAWGSKGCKWAAQGAARDSPGQHGAARAVRDSKGLHVSDLRLDNIPATEEPPPEAEAEQPCSDTM